MSSASIPPLDVSRLVWELASDKKTIRHAAFDVVYDGLALHSRRNPLDYLEMMRLWKGLYYLLWKEDNVNMQFSLCKKIAGLIHLLPEPTPEEEEAFKASYDGDDNDAEEDGYGGQAVLFVRCGLETLCREWPQVDYLRQSKVMRLVRDFVYALIERILTNYDEIPVEGDMLIHTMFLVLLNDSRIIKQASPKSLVIHFTDVWTDGMRRAIKKTHATLPFNEEKLVHLLLPWIEYVANSMDREIADSIGTNIFSRISDVNYNPPENFAKYIKAVDLEHETEEISIIMIVLKMVEVAKETESQRKNLSTECILNIKKTRRPWEKRMRGHVGSYRYAKKDPHERPETLNNEESSDTENERERRHRAKELTNSEILEQFVDELDSMCEWWKTEGEAILAEASKLGEEPAQKRILRKEEIAFIEAKQYLNRLTYAKHKDELHNVRVDRRGMLIYDPKVHERMLRTEDYSVIKPVLLSNLDPAKLEELFGAESEIQDEIGVISKGPAFYAREDLEDTDSIDADRSSSDSQEEAAYK